MIWRVKKNNWGFLVTGHQNNNNKIMSIRIYITVIILLVVGSCGKKSIEVEDLEKVNNISIETFFLKKNNKKAWHDRTSKSGPISFSIFDTLLLIPNRAEHSIIFYSLYGKNLRPIKTINVPDEPIFIESLKDKIIFSTFPRNTYEMHWNGSNIKKLNIDDFYFRTNAKGDLLMESGCKYWDEKKQIGNYHDNCFMMYQGNDYYLSNDKEIFELFQDHEHDSGYFLKNVTQNKVKHLDLDTTEESSYLTSKILGEKDNNIIILYVSEKTIYVQYFDKNKLNTTKKIKIPNKFGNDDSRMDDFIFYWSNDFIVKMYDDKIYFLRTGDREFRISKLTLP